MHNRLQDMADRLQTIYANLDIVHKNQEELLAQNLRVMNENKKVAKDAKIAKVRSR